MKTNKTYKLLQNDSKNKHSLNGIVKIRLDLEQTPDYSFYILLVLFFIEILLFEFPESIVIHLGFFAVFADFNNTEVRHYLHNFIWKSRILLYDVSPTLF